MPRDLEKKVLRTVAQQLHQRLHARELGGAQVVPVTHVLEVAQRPRSSLAAACGAALEQLKQRADRSSPLEVKRQRLERGP